MLIGFAVWMKRTEDAAKKSDVENTRNIDFASRNPLWPRVPLGQKRTCIVNIMESGDNFAAVAKVKFRGDFSTRYPKHSFAVEFQAPQSFSGLPLDDDYVLNADYTSKTLMKTFVNQRITQLNAEFYIKKGK